MATKYDILDNVSAYSATDLVGFIRSGMVTWEELCNETDGQFSVKQRKAVERLLEEHKEKQYTQVRMEEPSFQPQVNPDLEWGQVDKNDLEALQAFKKLHPESPHCREANKLINALMREQFSTFNLDDVMREIHNKKASKDKPKTQVVWEYLSDLYDRGRIKTEDILMMIRTDYNILKVTVIKKLLNEGILNLNDLSNLGIKSDFLKALLDNLKGQQFGMSDTLERISHTSTEVYFWGIPSSGKTCALGAILSVARHGSAAKSMAMNPCQGHGYMNRLSTIFKQDKTVGVLPESTDIFATNEMSFDLEDSQSLMHPLTCVDLAGELVRCMYKCNAGESMNEDEELALETLTRVLVSNRTTNRKIHFFVIEYGGHDRLYDGLSQDVYLEGALNYIKQLGVFKDDTDAIYVMLTKVDKARAEGGSLQAVLQQYLTERYQGFINGLKKICKDYEINNGKIEVVPFSLGEVCFQDYCLFDASHAQKVVSILLNRSKGLRGGRIGGFLNKLRK